MNTTAKLYVFSVNNKADYAIVSGRFDGSLAGREILSNPLATIPMSREQAKEFEPGQSYLIKFEPLEETRSETDA